MKGDDGQWHGLSIALWQRIAEQLNLPYRLEEADLEGLIDGVASGRFDAGVAALTITAQREAILDFSQPFYTTGLGIAVPMSTSGWWAVIRSVFSLGLIRAVLALAGLLAGMGLLIWLFERRGNNQFEGGLLKGIGAGFWWSAVTMTTVGYGDKSPTTVPGRLLAIAWMFTSIILISTFTAGITSALTANRLTGVVRSVNDLRSVRVGAVTASTTTDFLRDQHIAYVGYSDPIAALKALATGRLDAVVYDRPLLAWLIRGNFAEALRVLPLTFDKQTYGIALPSNSPLRETIDRVLLKDIHTDWWRQLVFSDIGDST